MKYIEKLIADNKQKLEYLEKYLTLNDVANARVDENNLSAVKELASKKKSLITAINVIDDKIIASMEKLKEEKNIASISELTVKEYPKLIDLKEIATEVLKKMVEVKKSDEEFLDKLDTTFENYKAEKGRFDKKKLEYYTKTFFE